MKPVNDLNHSQNQILELCLFTVHEQVDHYLCSRKNEKCISRACEKHYFFFLEPCKQGSCWSVLFAKAVDKKIILQQ